MKSEAVKSINLWTGYSVQDNKFIQLKKWSQLKSITRRRKGCFDKENEIEKKNEKQTATKADSRSQCSQQMKASSE